jgi:hypothetical protein
MVIWYTLSLPEEAVNPRLIDHYGVISGQDIDVTVLDQGGCPAAELASDADTNQSLLGGLLYLWLRG